MSKTLIIVTHPDIEKSVVNKRWIEELEKHPDKYVIHDIHKTYPDEKIDIGKEQQLVESYDTIVFQFPFYWFNCPPFFKKWLDDVLTEGWAYGRGSKYMLEDKQVAMGISAGIDEKDYLPTGRYKYTMHILTTPFEITFNYIKADYRGFYTFYGAEYHATSERVEKSTLEYIEFLESL